MKYVYEKLHKFEEKTLAIQFMKFANFFHYIILFNVASVLCVMFCVDCEHNVKL